MQTRNRLLDDIAKVANSAAGTLAGVKEEIENLIRHRVESLMADMNMVNRDEFNAVKAMVAKSRSEQERLEAKVKQLEAKINKPVKRSQPRKKATTKKQQSKI
jgi:BMFP domain-containing protein YqiC